MPMPNLDARVEIVDSETGIILLQSPKVAVYYGDLRTIDSIKKGHSLGTVYQLDRPSRIISPYDGQIKEVKIVNGQPIEFGQTICSLAVDPKFLSEGYSGWQDINQYVISPMPATLIIYKVAVGDEVIEGQTVAIIEAMKMEMELRAAYTGVVEELCIGKTPATVDKNSLLVKILRTGDQTDP